MSPSSPNPSPLLLLSTSLGLLANASFAAGSISLSAFPIKSMLIAHQKTTPLLSAQSSSFFTPLPEPNPRTNTSAGSDTGVLLRQWVYVFLKGARTFPPFAVIAAVSYLSAARCIPGSYSHSHSSFLPSSMTHAQDRDEGIRKTLYLVAAILSLAIYPFTHLMLGSTNSALYAKVEERRREERREGEGKSRDLPASNRNEDEGKEKEGGEIAELIAKWGKLNVLRSLLPCAAAGCAVMALCW